MRILIGLLSVTAAALAGAPGASAEEKPPRPSDVAAISVYMEVIPTSKGPRALPRSTPGTATPSTASVPLPSAARKALRTAPRKDAEALEELATSPQYAGPPARNGSAEAVAAADAESRSVLGAIAGTVGQSGRLLAFLAILALLTVGAVVAAVRRRYPPSTPST